MSNYVKTVSLEQKGRWPIYIGGGEEPVRAGKVTYINQQHGWYMVEFKLSGKYKVRECYKLPGAGRGDVPEDKFIDRRIDRPSALQVDFLKGRNR